VAAIITAVAAFAAVALVATITLAAVTLAVAVTFVAAVAFVFAAVTLVFAVAATLVSVFAIVARSVVVAVVTFLAIVAGLTFAVAFVAIIVRDRFTAFGINEKLKESAIRGADENLVGVAVPFDPQYLVALRLDDGCHFIPVHSESDVCREASCDGYGSEEELSHSPRSSLRSGAARNVIRYGFH
jgi:hypothetical protein